MQRQQILFGFSSGVDLSVLGGALALDGIVDWSLFVVCLGLVGIPLYLAASQWLVPN